MVWLVEKFRVWKYYQNIITLAHPSLLSFLLFFIPCNSWMMTLRINLPNRAYQHKHHMGRGYLCFHNPDTHSSGACRLGHFCNCQLESWYSFFRDRLICFGNQILGGSEYRIETNHLLHWRDYSLSWDNFHLPVLCLPVSDGIQFIFPRLCRMYVEILM